MAVFCLLVTSSPSTLGSSDSPHLSSPSPGQYLPDPRGVAVTILLGHYHPAGKLDTCRCHGVRIPGGNIVVTVSEVVTVNKVVVTGGGGAVD